MSQSLSSPESSTSRKRPRDVSPKPSQLTGVDGRVRFLRACDRCRRRKMKCDDANPCGKCAASGLQCTFDQRSGTSRVTTVAQSSVQPSETVDVSGQGGSRAVRRKESEIEVTFEADEERNVLGHSETAHFFTAQDGMPRFAGSTSGLPLLDIVRRQLRTNGTDKRHFQDQEPNWDWLSSLLETGPTIQPSPLKSLHSEEEEDEVEYFPGHSWVPNVSQQDIFSFITETIPADLLTTLVQTYFDIVHPKWPMIHMSTFFSNFYKWDDYAYAALVVAMCMMASRYHSDIRVRADPDNPASVGVKYFTLFRQLRDQAVNRDNVVYAVQSLLLAAQYQSVDNVPHPLSQGLMAEAAARCLDGGLHRETTFGIDHDSLDRETRRRTSWACYIWDKYTSAVCGRPPLLRISDYEVSLPMPFEETEPTSTIQPADNDKRHVTIFAQLAVVATILEKTVESSNHNPLFLNSELLNRISASLLPQRPDTIKFRETLAFLEEWRQNLPPALRDRTREGRLASPYFSYPSEQLAAAEMIVEILVSGRKMQLAMLLPIKKSATPENQPTPPTPASLEACRTDVLTSSRKLISLVVNLGSTGLLNQSDILTAYALLLAGRMTLAVLLSARHQGHQRQVADAEAAVQAVAVLLRHLVSTFPVALGAAEVFNETCRVCGVTLPLSHNINPSLEHRLRYAWYRPIGLRKPKKFTNDSPAPVKSHNGALDTGPQTLTGMENMGIDLDTVFDFQPFDSAFGAVSMASQGVSGFLPMSGGDSHTANEADFAWLLLGGNTSTGNNLQG